MILGKSSLVERRIRGEIEVFRGVRALVRALLLPTLDSLAKF